VTKPGVPNPSHQTGVCKCKRCSHPLLVDLPPPIPQGAEARRERLRRIMEEETPWKKKGQP
jgi:hypothetical protein